MLPPEIHRRLRLPLVVAPMTGVSGPELVAAACRAGAIGSFPTHNASSPAELERWMSRIRALSGSAPAPVAPNVVVHRSNPRLRQDVECLIDCGVEVVITSVGSPVAVLEPLKAAGVLVWSDVATVKHAQRAIALGVDGLVLLSAGAGGQTGWLNPLAFTRAIRAGYDGTLIMAGGISDGRALLASLVAGADLGYMGTRFIATVESQASAKYKEAIVRASADDVVESRGPSGLPANFLAESLPPDLPVVTGSFQFASLQAHPEIWPAGHTAHAVSAISPTAVLVDQLVAELGTAAAQGCGEDDPCSKNPTTEEE